MTDYFAHKYFEDPKAAEEIEDEDFNPDEVENLIKNRPDDWEQL